MLQRIWILASALARAWGVPATGVTIFCLGSGVTVFLHDRFQKSEDANRELAQSDARITRVVSYVDRQDNLIREDQKLLQKQVLEQYTALNSRIDTQNALILETLRRLPRRSDRSRRDETAIVKGSTWNPSGARAQ